MADKEFPSTQRCSRCGNIQKMGNKKVYKCKSCGLVIDRDLNSAYNLKMYPSLIQYYILDTILYNKIKDISVRRPICGI